MAKGHRINRSNQIPTLVAFKDCDNVLAWKALGDQVMGGQSSSQVVRAEEGYGHFFLGRVAPARTRSWAHDRN